MKRDAVPTAQGLERLIEALRVLPGVGPRSAQRMAYHLLQHDRAGAEALAQALGDALRTVRHCGSCNSFTEEELCALCRSPRRDPSLLCVVETPADLAMVEQTLSFSGHVFRADGPAVAARRHRAARHRPGPAARARRRTAWCRR